MNCECMLSSSEWTSVADIIENHDEWIIMNWVELLQPLKNYSSKEGSLETRKNCGTKGTISIHVLM